MFTTYFCTNWDKQEKKQNLDNLKKKKNSSELEKNNSFGQDREIKGNKSIS